MPTITIKNGTRTLKLTKRESDTLKAAQQICHDIGRDFKPCEEMANSAGDYLQSLRGQIDNGKPEAAK